MVDPSKCHHPLVRGDIDLATAHNVIHWGLAILVSAAAFVSLLGLNPALSAICLVIWVSHGYGYNMGLSKTSILAFLPISICFTGLTGWAWFLSHRSLGYFGTLYLAYVFTVILYQIGWSGFIKEMAVRERSNILVRMGARLIRRPVEMMFAGRGIEPRVVGVGEELLFDPGRAQLFGFTVKGVGIGLLMAMVELELQGTPWAVIWVGTCAVGMTVMAYLLSIPRVYERERELRNMSLMEIISIFAPIPLLVPWSYALVLMIVGVAYFWLMNRLLWGVVTHPKV